MCSHIDVFPLGRGKVVKMLFKQLILGLKHLFEYRDPSSISEVRKEKVAEVNSLGEPPYLIYNSRGLSLLEKLKRFIFRVPEHEGVKVSEELDRKRVEEQIYKPNIWLSEDAKAELRSEIDWDSKVI